MQHFASQAVAIKRSNESWVRKNALNLQIIPKIWQKTSRKRYIYIHVIVSFHFFPFQRFDGLGFWSSQRNPSLSWFPRNTRRAEVARNFFFFAPANLPPFRRLVGNWMVRAGSQSVRVSAVNFLEVCGIDSPLKDLPSRELIYPTWGKGKSSSKCHFWGIC